MPILRESPGRTMRIRSTRQRLAWLAAVALLVWTPLWLADRSLSGLAAAGGWARGLHLAAATALWLLGAFLLARTTALLLFDALLQKALRDRSPRLMKDVVSFAIFSAAIVGLLGAVFDLPVTGLATATGAVGMVVGFALRDMISDVFSGIAIHLERPFQLGDALRLDSGFTGRVVEMNWRTTRLLSPDQVLSVVPNGRMAAMELRNLSRPEAPWRDEIRLKLSAGLPSRRVLRILEAAVRRVDGINRERGQALLDGVDEVGALYRVLYWTTSVEDAGPARSRVVAALLEDLYHAGLEPVRPRQELYMAKLDDPRLPPAGQRKLLLSRVDLFSGLTEDELERLARPLVPRPVPAGERVVEQGREGDTLFVIVEGLLQVLVRSEGGAEVAVGSLHAGEFFGEFSLLTGEPRSASVAAVSDSLVYEIRKEHVEPILANRAELARHLSELLAERRLSSRRSLDASGSGSRVRHELSVRILEKMADVFDFLRYG